VPDAQTLVPDLNQLVAALAETLHQHLPDALYMACYLVVDGHVFAELRLAHPAALVRTDDETALKVGAGNAELQVVEAGPDE